MATMEKITNQSFGITTYAWQEVSEKLIDLWKIEQMLNDSIFLKKIWARSQSCFFFIYRNSSK